MTGLGSCVALQSDQSVIEAVLGGDREAFAILVRRYSRLAISVAAKVIQDRHAAEDAAQDAFVVAFQQLNSLRNRDAFAAWLCKITHRRALKIAATGSHVLSLQETVDVHGIERMGYLDREAQHLLHLVHELPDHECVVVIMRYFENHSVSDIAELTGQCVGTVTKKLSRARKRLRTWIEREKR